MIFKIAKGHGGPRVWYERSRKHNFRSYHVFSLSRLVSANGSCWKLIVGPFALAFGFK